MNVFRLFLLSLLCSKFCFSDYVSQYRQDEFINEVIYKNKKNGLFIEIGAFDGVSLSNSLFFERELNWSGVCVEPIPGVFKSLQVNRKCYCLEAAISDFNGESEFSVIKGIEMLSGIKNQYDPKHLRRIKHELKTKPYWVKANQYNHIGIGEMIINVDTYTFNQVMEMYNFNSVDFVTIDTEGGEDKIVKNIDFDKYFIGVFSIENNYGDLGIAKFLRSKGYILVKRLGCDEVYIHKKIYKDLDKSEIKNF